MVFFHPQPGLPKAKGIWISVEPLGEAQNKEPPLLPLPFRQCSVRAQGQAWTGRGWPGGGLPSRKAHWPWESHWGSGSVGDRAHLGRGRQGEDSGLSDPPPRQGGCCGGRLTCWGGGRLARQGKGQARRGEAAAEGRLALGGPFSRALLWRAPFSPLTRPWGGSKSREITSEDYSAGPLKAASPGRTNPPNPVSGGGCKQTQGRGPLFFGPPAALPQLAGTGRGGGWPAGQAAKRSPSASGARFKTPPGTSRMARPQRRRRTHDPAGGRQGAPRAHRWQGMSPESQAQPQP